MREEEELPEGWRVARLADVAEVQLGKMLDKAKQLNGSRSPYLRNANVRWGTFDLSDLLDMPFSREEEGRFSLAPGDVIVCEGGEPGRAAVWREKGSRIKFQKALLRVRPAEALLPDWLALSLRRDALAGDLEPYFTGSTIKHFTRQSLLDYSIELPPRQEQVRIVEGTQRATRVADGVRQRLSSVLATLRRFRLAVLSAGCDGRLSSDWRIDTGCSDGWPTVDLESVAESFSYGSAAKSSPTGRVPVLRMGNIQRGRLDWTDLVYTSDTKEIGKYRLSAGDVLFNRTNSPDLVGKTAVYRGEREAIYAGYLIRVRCSPELLPDFLNYSLNGPAGKEYLASVRTDGVSQSNINARSLAAFEFGLPSVAEQQEIVRRVEALFALANAIEKRVAVASARADKLTQAILAKAFRGELVPTEAEVNRRREASAATPPPAPRPTAARPAPRISR